MCRIHHGALFGAGVGVESSRFAWRSRTGAVARYRASPSFERPFCRHCGAKVPALSHLTDVMLVPAGALDGFEGQPRAHIFAASKSGLHEITDALPRFDAYPRGVDLPIFAAPTEMLPHESTAPAAGGSSAAPLAPTAVEAAPRAVAAGRCLCGEVGYALGTLPERLVHCHCSLCRRSRGGPFATTAAIPAELFWWTRGEDAISVFRMAPPRRYGASFCVQCGSLVPRVSFETGVALIPAGAFTAPLRPLPAVHVHVGSKAGWEVISDSWPQFVTLPPGEPIAELG